jgi:hypothetical protein
MLQALSNLQPSTLEVIITAHLTPWIFARLEGKDCMFMRAGSTASGRASMMLSSLKAIKQRTLYQIGKIAESEGQALYP